MSVEPRRPSRQDTFDLREQIHPDDGQLQAHADALNYGTDDEEHSMLEEDSEAEEGEDFIDEDGSSTLSIPNESIDFDMVYALHSFAATVEGQANVVKGDSLYLMDDSNSYWWLVRVLKTQEVGYIPAENIETPFERLARLNKHRNVDKQKTTKVCWPLKIVSATTSPSETAQLLRQRSIVQAAYQQEKSIHFNSVRSHHRYIPPLREGEVEDEEDEWDLEGFEDEDLDLAAEQMYMQSMDEDDIASSMDQDDGMQWDDTPADLQNRQLQANQGPAIPDALHLAPFASIKSTTATATASTETSPATGQQPQQLTPQAMQAADALQKQQQQPQAIQQMQQPQQTLRTSSSREKLSQDSSSINSVRDPAEATETRKMTVTPTIAREFDERAPNQPYLPSIALEEERNKRLRDEDSQSDDSSKKKAKGKEKMAAPVSSATYNKQAAGKLRKEQSKSDTEDEGKKKKVSVFRGLFGKKEKEKEKSKDRNPSIGSLESNDYVTRESEESSRSGHKPADGSMSPTTNAAQQQQQAINLRNAVSDIRAAAAAQADQAVAPSTPERALSPQVSEHASQLRERDQQQRDLYKQYLNRSPSSPPETQPSYGLQSAASLMLSSPTTNSALGPPTARPRPGSLILTSPSANDGQANLSVIRVFAGKNLQTEATFKTVLLNASTTANDLVKQAIQRFRLPSNEDEGDYFLTVKQVEGGASAVLQASEHPLVVFETLVVEAMELPKVKRSSVGSISSVSSNLSMHPAITKLSMNDFTDDSAVKFYLNRRGDNGADDSLNGHEGDETLIAESSHGEIEPSGPKSQYLSVLTSGPVTNERFSSPSIRFALQLVIYAEDLPDDMQFHPQTEAIVFKASLPDPTAPIAVSPVVRRKVFMFPKNVTVAEVTELGLERFGIQDGSSMAVMSIDGHERELAPSSRIIDAFPRPPQFRAPDRQAAANKRRSVDSAQLLGSVDDIKSDDPHLHRESTSSYSSEPPQSPVVDENKQHKQPSRQEIIAAQRAATRATQRAIVSASTNSVRGMDVLLPGNVVLRSSRYEVGDRMRYSYVEPDGETYDISDIIEQEWREMEGRRTTARGRVHPQQGRHRREARPRPAQDPQGQGQRARLRRHVEPGQPPPLRAVGVHLGVLCGRHGGRPPVSGRRGRCPRRSTTPVAAAPSPHPPLSRPGTTTPTAAARVTPMGPVPNTRRNPSVASIMSDQSGRGTPPSSPTSRASKKRSRPQLAARPRASSSSSADSLYPRITSGFADDGDHRV
ncbi:hypothetical protein BJ912DRAFT_1144388 [Pholiota molesta]|nr:hypothetical protein BJ912DRAFT_1144388 [Pholiota molesta]